MKIRYTKKNLFRTPQGWENYDSQLIFQDPSLYGKVPEFVLYNKETKETLSERVSLTPYIDPTDFYSQSFTVNKYIRHPKKYFYSLHETGGQYFYLGGIYSKDDSGPLSCEVDLFHLADPFDLGPYNYVYWFVGTNTCVAVSHNQWQMPPDQFLSLLDNSSQPVGLKP